MEIRTSRLLLREFRQEDYEDWRLLQLDPQMQEFEPPPLPEDESHKKLNRWVSEQFTDPRKHYAFVVTFPPSDQFRGWLTLTLNFEETREWEIGWMTAPECWGSGYATEAARALLQFAFRQLNAHRLTAFCAAGNQGSIRVMEKLGMTREGRLR